VGVGVGAGVVVLDGLLLVVALAVGVVWVEPQDVRTNAKTAIPPRPDRFIVVDPSPKGVRICRRLRPDHVRNALVPSMER